MATDPELEEMHIGDPRLFAKHSFGSSEVVVDAGQLWWAASDGVIRVSLDEAVAKLYAADAAPRGWTAYRHSLAVDDNSRYWLSINVKRMTGVVTAAIMHAPRP